MPTNSPIALAIEGFPFARLVMRGTYAGQYIGLREKKGATHTVRASYPHPHIDPKSPKGVIRCIYADPKDAVDFTGPDAKARAEQWIADRKVLAKTAMPYSALLKPRGRRYKTFVARRAESAANGSLYDKSASKTTMAKKTAPKPPAKKSSGAPKDIKNGITRPKAGTTTGKVWDIADKLGADRAAVIKEATKRGINLATTTTQYGKWRKYNGLEGRSAPKAAKKAAKKAPPKPPAKKKPAAPAPATTSEVATG